MSPWCLDQSWNCALCWPESLTSSAITKASTILVNTSKETRKRKKTYRKHTTHLSPLWFVPFCSGVWPSQRSQKRLYGRDPCAHMNETAGEAPIDDDVSRACTAPAPARLDPPLPLGREGGAATPPPPTSPAPRRRQQSGRVNGIGGGAGYDRFLLSAPVVYLC